MHEVLGTVADDVNVIVQQTLKMEALLNADNGKHPLLMLQANLGHGQFVVHQDEPGDPWHERGDFPGGGPCSPPSPHPLAKVSSTRATAMLRSPLVFSGAQLRSPLALAC